ncbi:hypothetical protein C8R45DRAFT_923045 [Mycena sanguinolenta]|nr:hypothetical protein C8R45DRAFT_923045 [Mycena sanguinolenta]
MRGPTIAVAHGVNPLLPDRTASRRDSIGSVWRGRTTVVLGEQYPPAYTVPSPARTPLTHASQIAILELVQEFYFKTTGAQQRIQTDQRHSDEYKPGPDTLKMGFSRSLRPSATMSCSFKRLILRYKIYYYGNCIPNARIYTGCFMEFLPFIASYADGKITIIGKGDAPISYTSLTDTAGFVAYVLTTVPSAQLENRILRLEGDRASWNDVAKVFKASVERAESFTGKDGEMRTGLLTLFETGAGSMGWDEPNKKEGSGIEAAGSANDL